MENIPNRELKVYKAYKVSKVRKVLAGVFGILVISFTLATTWLVRPATAAPNWQIKSVDTQIISKCWTNVPQDSIDKQVSMLKSLGVNYIAIGTPYDRPEEMAKWTTSIHNAGLNVWFRSHWLNWEGDEGQPKNMSTETYLAKTKQFIIDHPTFFKAGDSFTVNVEAENAGVANGAPFADWNAYRKFLVDEIDISNAAFNQIGLGGKIKTNWLSMNGWIIENALDQATVDKMGIITPDHYTPQGDASNPTPASKLASEMSQDLDRFYAKWKKPIMIGEWGHHIYGDTSDEIQKQAVEAVYNVFASKPYIMGVSYWDHMGNSTRIINDSSGTPTTFRPAADVIKSFYSGVTPKPVPTPDTTPDTTPAPNDNPTPTPTPVTGEKLIANFENGLNGFDGGKVVAGKNSNGAMQITNPANDSIGSKKQVGETSLAGYKYLELDINLNGNKLLDKDASALYFEQGGWKHVSLSDYVQNGSTSWQHVRIPLSSFTGLNLSSGAAQIGFRFWNNVSGNYTIDNIKLTSSDGYSVDPMPSPNPTPNPTPTPTPTTSRLISDIEGSGTGWDHGEIVAGYNSTQALRINNPWNGSYGSKKMLNIVIGDYNYIELDINLNGNKLLAGDASQLYFDQGGLKWVDLSRYVKYNGPADTMAGVNWQHIKIPLSDFAGLNKNNQLSSIGFRYWNTFKGSYDMDNIVLTK